MMPGQTHSTCVYILILLVAVVAARTFDSGTHDKRNVLESSRGGQRVRVKSQPQPLYAPDFLVIGEPGTHAAAVPSVDRS